MLVYAPSGQQPKLGRMREEMSEAEQIIYDHFSDPKFVEQLMKFLSLEDRKGKDKFNPRRFCLFKGLFRNFDVAFLPILQPHLERLMSDSHESTQRCAAEITAGMIRGSKHWTYEKVEHLWKLLCPLIKTALTNITVETYSDWGTCIATSCLQSKTREAAACHLPSAEGNKRKYRSTPATDLKQHPSSVCHPKKQSTVRSGLHS